MSAVATARRPADAEKNVKSFDIRQTSLSRGKKESLEKIYMDFPPALENILINYISLPAKVKIQESVYISYEDYQKAFSKSVLLSLFDIEPMGLAGLLRLDADLVLVAIDRILGGEGKTPTVKRDLSIIELKMSEALVNKILSRLNAIWEVFGECNFKFKSSAQMAGALKFLSPQEPVIVVSFLIKVGDTEGLLDVCLPMTFVKPFLVSMDKSQMYALGDLNDPKIVRAVQSKMEHIVVPVRVYLGELQLALKELTGLEKGDVIRLGSIDKDLVVKAESVPVFLGRPGVSNNRLAVEVVQTIQDTRLTLV